MRKRGALKIKIAAAVASVSIVAAAALGLTASNTVSASTAGAGEGAISGYTVNTIQYTLDSTNPDTISSVKFRVATADVSSTSDFAISSKLDSKWSANCDTRTFTAGSPGYTTVTCAYTGTLPDVETASALRVVVADK
ncbi:MAG TPA: hypothetical protein VM600_01225 [Actinomycetota bacterium]|nr:hypothetical protein [Actinomycetota bacterium]